MAPEEPSAVVARFREALARPGSPCEGAAGRREVSLVLSGEARHVFSPWISLEVHEHEHGAQVKGRFGPHPHLWTAFVGIYASMVFTFIAGFVYGFVQSTLAQPATGLYVAAGAACVQAVACGVDLLGRRVGAEQMQTMHDFVREVLPDAIEVHHGPDPG